MLPPLPKPVPKDIHLYDYADATDSIQLYKQDTLRSGGLNDSTPLVDRLTEDSGASLQWLRSLGLALSQRGQLGGCYFFLKINGFVNLIITNVGHSAPRTYRPESDKGLAGSAMITMLQRKALTFTKSSSLFFIFLKAYFWF